LPIADFQIADWNVGGDESDFGTAFKSAIGNWQSAMSEIGNPQSAVKNDLWESRS